MMRIASLTGIALVALLGAASVQSSNAKTTGNSNAIEAKTAISAAEQEVAAARASIQKGKELIARIPEDSPLMPDVAQVIQAASENWQVAVGSLKGAQESIAKFDSASNSSVANDYALLARVNSGVAVSGAKVVQIAISYVEAIADNKTESLDIIRTALQDAMASASQVQFNYERVKGLIAKKYSN